MKSTSRPLALCCFAALSLLASGCATILSGPNQKVEVFTEPPGATVTVGSQQIVSPGVLKLRRKVRATEVKIELAGYETRTFVMGRKTNGLVYLDFLGIPAGMLAAAAAHEDDGTFIPYSSAAIVVGGILVPGAGFAIDYWTGAAYKLDPPKIVVTLTPAAP